MQMPSNSAGNNAPDLKLIPLQNEARRITGVSGLQNEHFSPLGEALHADLTIYGGDHDMAVGRATLEMEEQH